MTQRVTLQLDNGKEKFIGLLEDGGVLHIQRDRTKHLYKKLTSYGIDEHVIHYTLAGGCNEIHLTETDTNQVYRIPFAVFKKKAISVSYKGHGAQLHVPLKYWYKQP